MRQLKLLLITLSLPSIVLLSSMRPLQAQEPCGTDALLEEQLKALGLTKEQYEQQFNERIRELRKRSPEEKRTLQDKVYKVPVVIHVMHYPENKYNISDEAVYEQMRITNEHYKEAHAGADRIPERFEDVRAGDTGIEFHLAQRDPDGATTTGITRTEVPNKTDLYPLYRGGWENIEKYRPPWNIAEYLNVWIAPPESLPKDLFGLARLPINVSAGFDGAVINTIAFGVRATNPYVFSGTKGTVFSHELGHSLNLYHTFHLFFLCRDSDYCDDTPVQSYPSRRDSNCNLSVSCGSVNMIENYMDYSADACQTMFTVCQRTRMRTTLESNRARKYLHERHGNKLLLLSDFMPRVGAVNTEVKIWGTLFSSTADDDSISFGGSEYIVADRFIADTRTGVSPTIDTLVVSAPSDVRAGRISVKVLDGKAVMSMQDFTILMVSGFLPTSGAVDTEVKIWGTGFSSTVEDDSISFGGSEYIVADRFIADTRTDVSPTTDTLVVSVPSDAQTGPISVKVLDGIPAVSMQDFTTLMMSGFLPTSGAIDMEVKIWGTLFSSTAEDDSISFGGSEYIVADRFIADTRTGLSSTIDTLVASVPSDAQTGPISVMVGTEADTSDGSFTVSSRPAAFGVSLSSEGGIRVYPNPNAGQLRFVHLSSGGTYMYKVYSLVGRVLLWGRLGRAETLDVNMLADGQYVLVLQTKQGEELLRTRLLVLR